MKQDKKKFVVLGALVVVIISVGAFQFLSSGSTPASPSAGQAKKSDKATTEPSTDGANKSADAEYGTDNSSDDGEIAKNETVEGDPMQQLYSMNLAARDPFVSKTPLLVAATAPRPPIQPTPRTFPSSRSGMSMPPMNPMPGGLPSIGIDPSGQSPNIVVTPQAPAYSVSGVIRGETNAVVIADAQGNQRLIREGQAIDGDARVESIHKNKVVIRKKDGKTITLSVGGNP